LFGGSLENEKPQKNTGKLEILSVPLLVSGSRKHLKTCQDKNQ